MEKAVIVHHRLSKKTSEFIIISYFEIKK